MSDSIDAILQLPQRKIVIAENDVFLDKQIKDDIFILMVEESIGSAGGMAAGLGYRRIHRIYGFSCYGSGKCTKFFHTIEQDKIDQFDIPYSAVAMDIRLRSEEHTSELQSRQYLVCRLLLEKKKENLKQYISDYLLPWLRH